MEYHFRIKCDFLQGFSVISLSSSYLVLISSLLICNKLSNEWSAVFMGQLVLSEIKNISPKKVGGPGFERTLVRLFGDSN